MKIFNLNFTHFKTMINTLILSLFITNISYAQVSSDANIVDVVRTFIANLAPATRLVFIIGAFCGIIVLLNASIKLWQKSSKNDQQIRTSEIIVRIIVSILMVGLLAFLVLLGKSFFPSKDGRSYYERTVKSAIEPARGVRGSTSDNCSNWGGCEKY